MCVRDNSNNEKPTNKTTETSKRHKQNKNVPVCGVYRFVLFCLERETIAAGSIHSEQTPAAVGWAVLLSYAAAAEILAAITQRGVACSEQL